MTDLLEALYKGELYPEEQIVPKSKEYQEVTRASDQVLSKLEEMLGNEEKDLVEQLLDLEAEANTITRLETFKYGFSLGLRLRQEAQENPYLSENEEKGK